MNDINSQHGDMQTQFMILNVIEKDEAASRNKNRSSSHQPENLKNDVLGAKEEQPPPPKTDNSKLIVESKVEEAPKELSKLNKVEETKRSPSPVTKEYSC